MIKIIDNAITPEAYNNVASHPLQSWEWGEARRAMGVEVMRLGEWEGSALHQVYEVTFHRVPHTPYMIGYVPRSHAPSVDVLHFLHTYGKEHKVVYIKIEPNVSIGTLGIDEFLGRNPALKKSSLPLFPDWSLELNLQPQEEELLKHMHQKTRYNIRLAERKGVRVVEQSTEEGFIRFQKLYFDTCRRQGYFGHDRNYHATVWKYLQEGIAHIFIALYQGEPIAAFEVFLFHDTLYYPYGGSATTDRNVMAPHLLMWEVIRFGQRHGATRFDMWGSLPPGYNPTHPWAGFTRFKEGFGARPVQFVGSFDLVLLPHLYWPLMCVQKIRQKYLHSRR